MPLIRKSPSQTAAAPAESDISQATLAALKSGSSDERWAAVRKCQTTSAGLKALSDALAREDDPRVRGAIFTQLARVASPESVAVVLPYLRYDNANVRTGALDALRAMPVAVAPHLKDLLADPDSDVRLLACEIVRGLPSPAATELLCSMLEREDQANVCAAAVDVLAEIGNADALPVLADLGKRFPDEVFLGFAIKIAVQRIGDQAKARE